MTTLDFWLHTPRPLMDVADAIESALGTTPFEYDGESVWEWATAQIAGEGVELDISRKHREGNYREDDPVRIVLTIRDVAIAPEEVAAAFGPQLAEAVGVLVHHGQVVHLKDHTFDYQSEASYAPPPPDLDR